MGGKVSTTEDKPKDGQDNKTGESTDDKVMDQPKHDDGNYLEQFNLDKHVHVVDFMRIWYNYDKNKSGYLDAKETKALIKDLLEVHGEKKSPDDIKLATDIAMQKFDFNKNGKVEITEFAWLMNKENNILGKYPYNKKLPRDQFNEIFSHYDKTKTGELNTDELLGLVRDLFERNGMATDPKVIKDYVDMVLSSYERSEDGFLKKDEVALLLARS